MDKSNTTFYFNRSFIFFLNNNHDLLLTSFLFLFDYLNHNN